MSAVKKTPKAIKYFSTSDYVPLLEKRAIYQKHLIQYPNYACFDIGPYSFSEYKVVWKALGAGMQSCVISKHNNKVIVPDHNVMMIPVNNEIEAYYISGILNSDLATLFVTSYIEWFYSAHILEYFNIPKYNEKNSVHQTISKLSVNAHKEKNKDKLIAIEKNLNEFVNKLFGV